MFNHKETIMKRLYLSLVSFLLLTHNAFASQGATGMPWEQPLRQIAESLQGPAAQAIAVIALICAAFSLMFLEINKGMRWFVAVIIGFAIITGAFNILVIFGLDASLM